MQGNRTFTQLCFSIKLLALSLFCVLMLACASNPEQDESQAAQDETAAEPAQQVSESEGMTEEDATATAAELQPLELNIAISDYAEQELLFALTKSVLARDPDLADIVVNEVRYDTFTDVYAAMNSDAVNFTWSYTATLMNLGDHQMSPPYSPDLVYQEAVKNVEPLGYELLNSSPLRNDYAFAVRIDNRRTLTIYTISDLLREKKPLLIAMEPEFLKQRVNDGWNALRFYYGSKKSPHAVKSIAERRELYRELRTGGLDAGLVYQTDQELDLGYLRMLKDDQQFFAPYNLVPVIRTELVQSHPKLVNAMNAISASLNNPLMRYLLQRYEIDGLPMSVISDEFLICENQAQIKQETDEDADDEELAEGTEPKLEYELCSP